MIKRYVIPIWVLIGYVLAAAIVIAGCAPMVTPPLGERRLPDISGMARLLDCEARVICYMYASVNGAGLSCLPLADTRLVVSEICE